MLNQKQKQTWLIIDDVPRPERDAKSRANDLKLLEYLWPNSSHFLTVTAFDTGRK